MEALHDLGHAVREYVGGGQGDTLLEDDGEMENGDAEMDVNTSIESGECRFHRRQKFRMRM